MKTIDEELQMLLDRWREGALTDEEMLELTARLEKPEAREMMRRDWFLDAALPQSLAASDVVVRTPRPSLAVRWRAGLAGWLTAFAPRSVQREEPVLAALQLWRRASLGALAAAAVVAVALVWTPGKNVVADFTPRQIAAAMLSNELPDSP